MIFWSSKMILGCSTGLPGGNQVDGLPPAASTDRVPIDAPATKELIAKSRKFFQDFFDREQNFTQFFYSRQNDDHLQPAVNRQPGYRQKDS